MLQKSFKSQHSSLTRQNLFKYSRQNRVFQRFGVEIVVLVSKSRVWCRNRGFGVEISRLLDPMGPSGTPGVPQACPGTSPGQVRDNSGTTPGQLRDNFGSELFKFVGFRVCLTV